MATADSSKETNVADDTVRVVVLDDAISYTYWDERTREYVHVSHKSPFDKATGRLRDPDADPVVEIPRVAYERLEKLKERKGDLRDYGRPRVVLADDYESHTAEQTRNADPVQKFTDEQLQQMAVPDLIAELNTTPGLAERVLPLERDRSYTRKAIVEHCERLIGADNGEDVSVAKDDPTVPRASAAPALLPSED